MIDKLDIIKASTAYELNIEEAGGYEPRDCFAAGAEWVLKNLWKSVKEDGFPLPAEGKKRVSNLCAVIIDNFPKVMFCAYYITHIGWVYANNGQKVSLNITHYMEIPSMGKDYHL